MTIPGFGQPSGKVVTTFSQPCTNHATTLFQPCHYLVARLLQGCHKLATMLSIHGIKIAALPCDTVVTFFLYGCVHVGYAYVSCLCWEWCSWFTCQVPLCSTRIINQCSLRLGRLAVHIGLIMGVASILFHVRIRLGGEVEEVQRQIKLLSSV